jgi:Gpi18-like mannosyltransferase
MKKKTTKHTAKRHTAKKAAQRFPRWLLILIIVAFILRLGIAIASQPYVGRLYDINSNILFGKAIVTGANPYLTLGARSNIPPLSHFENAGLIMLFGSGAAMVIAYKLIVAFFSGCTVLLLYRIVKLQGWSERRALLGCTIFAVHPVLLLIDGVHGNIDTVVIYLIVLAIYLLSLPRRRELFAAFAIGMAIALKHYAAFIMLVLLFHKSVQHKVRFFLVAAAPVTMVFLPFLFSLESIKAIINVVFLYNPGFGNWGLSLLLTQAGLGSLLSSAAGVLFQHVWKAILLAAVLLVAWQFRKRDLFAGALAMFLVILVFAQGIGIQYYAWIIALSIIAWSLESILVSVLTTISAVGFYAGNFLKYTHVPFIPAGLASALPLVDNVARILLWGVLIWWLIVLLRQHDATRSAS